MSRIILRLYTNNWVKTLLSTRRLQSGLKSFPGKQRVRGDHPIGWGPPPLYRPRSMNPPNGRRLPIRPCNLRTKAFFIFADQSRACTVAPSKAMWVVKDPTEPSKGRAGMRPRLIRQRAAVRPSHGEMPLSLSSLRPVRVLDLRWWFPWA